MPNTEGKVIQIANFSKFENPITGKQGNLFDLGGMWQMILGVLVVLFVWATGQKLAGAVSKRVPSFDTTPNQIFSPSAVTSTSPREIY
jgi:hypothetical protein